MDVKLLEIRDEGTMISVLAIDMNNPANAAQERHLRSQGYPLDGRPNVAITQSGAHGRRFSNDPYTWADRTWSVAHQHIIDNWSELRDGDVIDVSFILGETPQPKTAEVGR